MRSRVKRTGYETVKTRDFLIKIGIFGSMRGKLAFYFMLLAILPLLVIVTITLQSEETTLSERIKGHLAFVADLQKDRVRAWLHERGSDVLFIAGDEHIAQELDNIQAVGMPTRYRDSKQYLQMLNELNVIQRNNDYLDVSVLDKKGRVVTSTRKSDLGVSRKDEGYFKGAMNLAIGKYFIQDIYFNKELNEIAMAVSAPVPSYSDPRKISGVAVVVIGMDRSFYPFFESWPGMGKSGDILIGRLEGGEIVFLNRLRYNREAPLKFRVPVGEDAPKPIMYASSGHEGIIETADYRGAQVLAAYRYIPETKWGLVVKEDREDAFSAVNNLIHKIAFLVAVTVVLVFWLIYFITAKITKPIVSLDMLAGRIAQGDFSVSLPVKRKDEVGSLAGSFNDMAKALMDYRKEVEVKSGALRDANSELTAMTGSLEEKVKSRTQELEELNRALISMMEDLDERTVALEASQVEMKKFAKDLEESRNRIRENLEIVERANVELRRIDRMKDQFLGMMSHELRTPLSLITGYSSNLLADRSTTLDPRVEEALDGIYKGAERLKNIVTEMLDISQIDAKGLRLAFMPVNIGMVVKDVMTELDTFVMERKQGVAVGDFTGFPEIYIDTKRLHQVLLNIIGNAIKFTPDGGRIEITPRLYDRGSDFVKAHGRAITDYLDIEVKDSGIGLDKEEADRIFEKFYEVGEIEKHSTSKYRFLGRGVGLGLPIARGIIEAHGGRLWVDSPGYNPDICPGSSFHIFLPVGQDHRDRMILGVTGPEEAVLKGGFAGARQVAAAPAARPKVLLIEDDKDIMNLTNIVLGRDYEVVTARDGSAGIEKAREIMPDLILLDVYMEGLTGYEVCEILKADEKTKNIPVAMFTAGVQRWEVEKGFKSGADDYITKPFQPDELREKVRDLIAGIFNTARNKVD